VLEAELLAATLSAMRASRNCDILWPLLVVRLPSSSVVHVRSGLSSWPRIVQPANSLAAVFMAIGGRRNTLLFNARPRVRVFAGPKAKATFIRNASDSRLPAHSDSIRSTFAGTEFEEDITGLASGDRQARKRSSKQGDKPIKH